jgi:hypothetical protein
MDGSLATADILSHYGKLGMHWGRRTATSSTASPDAKSASESKAKIKKSGTDSLTTPELQVLVTRMNLEQQYSTIKSKKKNPAAKFATDLLVEIGKDQAKTVARHHASRLVAQALKG